MADHDAFVEQVISLYGKRLGIEIIAMAAFSPDAVCVYDSFGERGTIFKKSGYYVADPEFWGGDCKALFADLEGTGMGRLPVRGKGSAIKVIDAETGEPKEKASALEYFDVVFEYAQKHLVPLGGEENRWYDKPVEIPVGVALSQEKK